MIFRYRTKKTLGLLKSGQIIKYHKLLEKETILLEFSYYDEDEDIVYWQTAQVLLGDTAAEDKVLATAKIVNSGRLIYENIPFKEGNRFTRANDPEKVRFKDAYDKHMTRLWTMGKLDRSELLLHYSSSDLKLSRLELAVEPPQFLYVKTDVREIIFCSAPLSTLNGFTINFKEMIMINDAVSVYDNDKVYIVCDYDDASIIRRATDTEVKLLKVKAKQIREETEKKFKTVKLGTAVSTVKYVDTIAKAVLVKKEDRKEKEQKKREERRVAELKKLCDCMKTFSTKILVSNGGNNAWAPAIFGYVTKSGRVMVVGGHMYKHCLLYKDHRELLGKRYNNEDIPPDK